MKLIVPILFLIVSGTYLFGQTKERPEYNVKILGSPRKAELIVISTPISLPTYFCKVGNHIIMGEWIVKDGKLDGTMGWTTGYLLMSDSLKLADYFDNYRLDSLELFGDQGHSTNPSGATYYKIKRKRNESTYHLIKTKKVIYEWEGYGSSSNRYEGPLVPVIDGSWKD
ncbi:hypothetical protein [Fluviicola sp.]|uniref:hypothetical protein n=1 Tax=Fluviicola sp. TaxID=1917219 RepID=UPI003D2A11CA